MSRNESNKVSVNVSPQVSTNKSGKITGGGAAITLDNKKNNTTAGAYFAKPNYSALYAEHSKQVSANSQVKVGGMVDNRGSCSFQAGVSFKF